MSGPLRAWVQRLQHSKRAYIHLKNVFEAEEKRITAMRPVIGPNSEFIILNVLLTSSVSETSHLYAWDDKEAQKMVANCFGSSESTRTFALIPNSLATLFVTSSASLDCLRMSMTEK